MSEITNGTLVTGLEHAHEAWRKEIGEGLARARVPEAGVWERWSAVRYLREHFTPRLDDEVHVLTALADRIPPGQAGRVWALGELLQFLARHLCELGGMPQGGPAFAEGTNKLLRAFDCWCVEAEAAARATSAGGVPAAAVQAFDHLFTAPARGAA